VLPVPAGVPEEPDAVAALVADLRDAPPDLALQLHGGGRHANPLVRALGARVTAGSHTPDAEPLDRSLPYLYLQPEVLRYLELVGLVGARPVGLDPALALTEADRAAAAEVLEDAPAPLALLHPGATDPRRRWPAERFGLVGDALARAGAAVLVNGGPAEQGLVQAVLRAMEHPARAVSLDLRTLPGVLAACRVVVANDTGPLHLAGAVGTSTVGLFWGPNVINSPPPGRARHRPLAALDLHCPVCGTDGLRGSCEHEATRLGPIRADEVAAVAQELLGVEPKDRGAWERALDPRAAATRAPVA